MSDTDDWLNDVSDLDLDAILEATSPVELDAQLDDVEHAAVAPDQPGAVPPAKYQPLYGSSAEFMVEFVGKTISRRLSENTGTGLRWDVNWWRYKEAEFRADIMWRTFEAARVTGDPDAMEAWARLVLDHHMGVLLNGSTGPMAEAPNIMETLGATYPETDQSTND